jgi:hypothetical protein
MTQHLSVDALRLAAEFDIPLTFGELAPLSDTDYFEFSRRYREWSKKRDQALRAHITNTPTLFRALLPYSERVLATASQVVWYLDEILTKDPVLQFLDAAESNVEGAKDNLRRTLQILAHFRWAMESGFILFYGEPFGPSNPKEPLPHAAQLATDTEVRDALIEAAYCGYEQRVSTEGIPGALYQIKLDAGGIFGCALEGVKVPAGETFTVRLPLGQDLPKVSAEKLRQILMHNPFEQADGIFGREIQRALLAAEAAKNARSAILFDRTVDGLILNKAGFQLDVPRQTAVAQVLNVAAPYLKGVKPEHLAQIRDELPNAFRDFRARLHRIVDDGMRDGLESVEELRLRADGEISPAIQALDSELQAEARRGRIIGYGTPAIVAAGLLAGAVAGFDPAMRQALRRPPLAHFTFYGERAQETTSMRSRHNPEERFK